MIIGKVQIENSQRENIRTWVHSGTVVVDDKEYPFLVTDRYLKKKNKKVSWTFVKVAWVNDTPPEKENVEKEIFKHLPPPGSLWEWTRKTPIGTPQCPAPRGYEGYD